MRTANDPRGRHVLRRRAAMTTSEVPELTLGIGLVFAAAGAGLLQFELVGLFGIVLLALGAGMLLSAGVGARPAHEPPVRVSLAAFVAAIGLLLFVAVSVSYVAFASHRV